ncbi:autotransporter domain-containing protein [Sebaldella sp. S0638]|uniref:autotransporter domain-containing protein n=1 Tax=Sebaldella sp. S0638 TaxID=2957809 RepID=UPI00209FE9CF|nr:autotransporter domain-containing protein [Sebaldella sp. S0638]MCP1223401.1 autotransporter domain-containing protein [Sebaldella sp. S0638]
MKKNKSIIAFSLALNAVLSTYSGSAPAKSLNMNSDNVYNKIIKDMKSGKSSNGTYKMLEDILNKRNKELKDLYLQGDYIVKPEYLEWQIFASAFYAERDNGDNTSENARYRSGTEGYYDSNGEFVSTTPGAKPYKPPQEPKIIDLGMSIPLREINRENFNIQINLNAEKPAVPAVQGEIVLDSLKAPNLDLITFNPQAPIVNSVNPPTVSIVIPSLIVYANSAGDTLLGVNVNVGAGTHTLSTVAGMPGGSNTYKDNSVVEYGGNGGSFSSAANSEMVVDVSKRRAVSIDSNKNLTFTNNGKVTLVSEETAGLEVQSNYDMSIGSVPTVNDPDMTAINNGTIEGKGNKQVAMVFTPEQDAWGLNALENRKDIIMSGSQSTGIALNGAAGRAWKLKALNSGNIELNGTKSFGIALPKNSNLMTGSSILNDTAGIITVKGDESGGIVVQSIIESGVLNKGSIAINSNKSFGLYSEITNEIKNDGKITLTGSSESIGLRSAGGFLSNTASGKITVTGGSKNIGMYASSGKVENSGEISITAGTDNTGAVLNGASSSGKNTGKISVSGTGSSGIIVTDGASFENTNELTVSGADSYGLIAKGGTVKGGTVNIDVTGSGSVGAYAGGSSSASNVEITGGNVNLSGGGINFNSGQNGTLNLKNTKFITGKESLGFYATGNGIINIQNLEGTIKGGSDSTERGTAFYVIGSGVGSTNITTSADIESLLASSGINISGLKLNMESGSRLFSLGNVSLNLSVVDGINTAGFTTMTINGSDYKTILLHKGLLNIDKNVNLDDTNSDYTKIEMANSSIINNSIITGAGNSKVGMAQANAAGLAKNTVNLVNNGEINLSGQESIGIYSNYGIIENNNIIETSGSKSYGIYGVNGTEVITAAGSEIKTGSEGAGIVLQSYVTDPLTGTVVSSGYGDGTFKLEHDGKITVSGSKSFGIYADNNDAAVSPSITNRIVNLNAGSMIDLSGTTDKGTGVYANRSTVNSTGDIKVGSNGAGIYSKDSKININGGIIELAGTDSTGIILSGTSDLTATAGTINVKGNNNTVFVVGAGSVTTGLENILVNIDPGLKLTLANVKNNTFTYDGTISGLGEESVLIYGDNSNISLGNSAVITSTAAKVTGLAATGQKAVNKGVLSLTGSNSTGIYTDGADAVNENNIVLGVSGIGIYNKGAKADNISGEIKTGENGVGIFGTDSTSLNNNASINSAEKSVIGIYSEGDITGTSVKNDGSGVIDLSGENSIGIYTAGTSAKTITNDGIITMGNSSDINNPSIGIYSSTSGNSIINANKINTGDNSVGIYSKDGTVTQSGDINSGNAGTGIYASGGLVNLNNGSSINVGSNEAVAVYAVNGAGITNNSSGITLGNKSIGFVLESGATLTNNGSITLGDENIFVYGNGAGTVTSSNIAAISATGSNNIVFYTVNGGNVVNNSSITADTGTGNIGIYNKGGSIENHGDIYLGNSQIIYNGSIVDAENSRYSVGVYGENSKVENYGNISLGEDVVGVYVKDNSVIAKNHGIITAGSLANPKKGAIGIFADGGVGFENFGDITLYGEGVIGIAGKNAGKIINHAVISVTGENSVGIYGTLNTEVENKGTINVSGNNGIGIIAPDGKIINEGTINFSDGASSVKLQDGYAIPELINAGIINVNGHFSNEGMEISLKPNLDTLQESTIPGVDFTLNSGSISANSMHITDTVKILPDFSQGTNAKVYKLEDVFLTSNGTITSSNGKIPVVSKSLTWEATPKVNADGNVDIYMQKIDYHDFTDGLWYDDFGKALDDKYAGASGDGGKIFDQIDLLENERDFRHVMASLAGNVYSNINQREDDMARVFENSLDLLQNSTNNTKENVKINVIAGKGRNTEDTDGVVGYDYTTTGVLALREVERTYRHTFGYSLGYLHTGFEFKDGNQSEEWVDTVQLGIHNKYKANDWKVLNNLTGRVSFHNIDRNIDWPSPTGRSEMNGSYETYSVTSDNILGREFSLGKKASITPYGAFRAMYVTRPDFSEKGLEALEVEGNDAWSAKPRVGVEVKGAVPLGSNTAWQLKGALDVAYEYELADLNERERARLISVEDNYHKLSKPEDEKGTFRTRASIGVEIEDRYGIFINGEYGVGNDSRDDYRAGVTLKAVF